jgi:F0F1-type ATP synthase membrane subunit b/b'
MAKAEIKKLIDDANKLLETEYDNQVNTIKNELRSFKSKTLEKIQKNTP